MAADPDENLVLGKACLPCFVFLSSLWMWPISEMLWFQFSAQVTSLTKQLTYAEVLCMCVGWDGSVPELKEVNSISPGNSVLGQELWAIYKERRKVAKMLSQTCIQEQSRHQGTENSVSSLHRMPVGHPWGTCHEGDQKSLLQWLELTTAFPLGLCLQCLPVCSTYQSTCLRKLHAFLLLKTWVPVCPQTRLKLLLLAQSSPWLASYSSSLLLWKLYLKSILHRPP